MCHRRSRGETGVLLACRFPKHTSCLQASWSSVGFVAAWAVSPCFLGVVDALIFLVEDCSLLACLEAGSGVKSPIEEGKTD